MQGNDLGNDFGYRIVVVMEPLLVEQKVRPSALQTAARRLRGDSKLQTQLAGVEVNQAMVAFIKSMGYQYSIGTEIWSFLNPGLYEALAARLSGVLGHNVVAWQRWDDVRDASARLRTSPEIQTVYDADLDRIELWWQLRGQRVLTGRAP